MGPPPPPAYGFHMLERRTIVLADGSVRSYFALPLDYQDFPRPLESEGRFLPVGPGGHGHHELGGGFDRRFPPGGPMSPGGFNRHQDYWNSLGLDGRGNMEGSMKRKFAKDEEKDLRRDEKEEFLKQRHQFMQYVHQNNGFSAVGPGGRGGDFITGTSGDESRASKYMRICDGYENVGFRQTGGGSGSGNVGLKRHEIDQNALKKAFLNFSKLINENTHQRKNYLEEGKLSRLQCIACGRFDAIGSLYKSLALK